MTFKPAIWYPISAVLGLLNLAAVGFAAGSAEPWHATAHAGLAVAFGLWAQRLRKARGRGEEQPTLEVFEAEVDQLRTELSELQERVDFTERLLAQRPEPRRLDSER
jgi:hypothetical protein